MEVNYYTLTLVLVSAQFRYLLGEVLLDLQELHFARLVAFCATVLLLTVVFHKLLGKLLLLEYEFLGELVDVLVAVVEEDGGDLVLDPLAVLGQLVDQYEHLPELLVLRLQEEVHVRGGLGRRVHD